MIDNILRQTTSSENRGWFAPAIPNPESAVQLTEEETNLTLLGAFLAGNVTQVSSEAAKKARTVTNYFGRRPEVCVHSSSSADFLYNDDDGYGEVNTTRVTIDCDGNIVGFGSGEFWEDNDYDSAEYANLQDALLNRER